MRSRLVAALAAGSALMLASVPAAFAWQGPVADGAPDLNHDSPTGYYIWHNDNGFHLRTHGPNARHDFDARLTTDGTFEDVDVVRLESRDGVQVLDGGHELTIHFNTFDATDGVNFRIDGGERLRLALRLDGQLIGTERIFLGHFGAHPERNPFVLRR
jgi:hypothetical protein